MLKQQYKVRVSDCDAFALIKYPKYIEWINSGKEGFFRFCGCDLFKIESMGINLVTGNLTLHNKYPCYVDDVVDVVITLDNVLKEAVFFKYEAINVKNGQVVFDAETELICFDRAGKRTSLPEEIFQNLLTRVEARD